MTRTIKKIICLTMVIALVIAFASPAFAVNEINDITPAMKQRFGAWVASALMAGQIFIDSTVAPIVNAYNFLSDPFDVSYSYADTYYQDWMDKNKIVIDSNHVQIDGRWYDNVWLSHDAADKFRTNALDFKTAYNIANNTNGIFATGVGTFNGTPVYNVDGVNRTQVYKTDENGTYDTGFYTFTQNDTGIHFYRYGNNFWNAGNKNYTSYDNYVSNVNYTTRRFTITAHGYQPGFTNTWRTDVNFSSQDVIDNTPFDYNWVSKEVDLDPLQPNEGLSILVPHEQMEPFYNEHPDFNPQLNPDINIDVDAPDFPNVWDMVDDIIDIISDVLRLLPDGNVKYEPQPDPAPQPPVPDPDPFPDPEPVPYPDPDPEPGTTLPDIDWSELFNTIKNIYNAIAQGNVISQTIANIANEIRNFTDNLKWQVEQLRDQLGDIVEKIIHGNKDWFNDIVDSIKAPFIPWINAFKSGVGIWHYVVEWITYITVPFVFFFNTTKEINTNLVLPIYALIAGTIVIAIYRRFGR